MDRFGDTPGVANKMHWVLDVQFEEDAGRAREGNAAENLATLRRLSLNLLSRDQGQKSGTKTKRLVAGWDNSFLVKLLAF